jgi:D-alanyl-D-alanine carboxypeptidase
MEREACDHFIHMAKKAREDNVHLIADSGYRSIHSQKRIFRELMSQGRSWDDLVRYVAPPAYSEHMLGTVVDLYPSDWQFASTVEYAWLQEHASTFGFTESYPESGKNGFHWEPWHWKFIPPQQTWTDR